MTNPTLTTRTDKEFDEWMKKIKKKTNMSKLKIQREITKIPDIEKSLLKNKDGFVFDIFTVIISALAFFIFLVGFMYGFNLVTTTLRGVDDTNMNFNITEATDDTFGQTNTSMAVWYWMLGIIMFGMFLSILITNFLVKTHPVFFFVYVFVIVIAIIFSVVIANVFETSILTNEVIGQETAKFVMPRFIFLNLPIWVTIFGFLGAIFLFINIQRDEELGGGI